MGKRTWITTGALVALGALSAVPATASGWVGVHVSAPQVYVAPPPLRYEYVPAARPGHLWVAGHWEWQGNRHAWVPGHWIVARHGHYYQQAQWHRDGERWAYRPGGWHRGDRDRDGIPDRRDRDLDNDGIRNHHDRDMDGDGVPNRWDRSPTNRYRR